jgi:hypothetical protein
VGIKITCEELKGFALIAKVKNPFATLDIKKLKS